MVDENEIVSFSLKLRRKELEEIDLEWRKNMEYRNRSDYIRARLGLEQIGAET